MANEPDITTNVNPTKITVTTTNVKITKPVARDTRLDAKILTFPLKNFFPSKARNEKIPKKVVLYS